MNRGSRQTWKMLATAAATAACSGDHVAPAGSSAGGGAVTAPNASPGPPNAEDTSSRAGAAGDARPRASGAGSALDSERDAGRSPDGTDTASIDDGLASAPRDVDGGGAILAPLGPAPTGRTFTLSVNVLGAGLGRVVSSPLGIDCSTTCSAAFDEAAVITLRALPDNGSDSLRGSWSLSSCGARRDCVLPPLTVDQTVEASFEPMAANVAFINSDSVPTNLGSARAYDAVCNASATRAGINNLTGDRFVAVVSDATETFRARLGSDASGWVLPDGRPFAGTIEQLLDEQRVYNALSVSETGLTFYPGYQRVLTNSLPDGTGPSFDGTCDNLTSLEGAFRGGEVSGGPGAWIDFANFECGRDKGYLYCMGRDRASSLVLPATPGLRIWLSDTPYHPGGADGTPDAHCQAALPPGVANARALITRADGPASAVLDLESDYVRPDGIRVGSGNDLLNGFSLSSGIWQQASGRYVPRLDTPDTSLATWAWTGGNSLTSPGTPESTCNDWTSASGLTITGAYSLADNAFWFGSSQGECGRPGGGYLYCVEAATAAREAVDRQ